MAAVEFDVVLHFIQCMHAGVLVTWIRKGRPVCHHTAEVFNQGLSCHRRFHFARGTASLAGRSCSADQACPVALLLLAAELPEGAGRVWGQVARCAEAHQGHQPRCRAGAWHLHKACRGHP